MDSTLVTLAVGILSFIGILVTLYRQRKDAEKNTLELNKLQQELNKSNRFHEHRTQTLHRAREALITMQKSFTYMNYREALDLTEDENIMLKTADMAASMSEIKGISEAINEPELSAAINSVNQFHQFTHIDRGTREDYSAAENLMTAISSDIHRVITKLLEKTI